MACQPSNQKVGPDYSTLGRTGREIDFGSDDMTNFLKPSGRSIVGKPTWLTIESMSAHTQVW